MQSRQSRRRQGRSPTPATIAIIIFAVLAVLRLFVFRPESPTNAATRERVTVRRVIDGDTLDLTDGRRVRLLGLDAPEAGFNGKESQPWSEESTNWLRERIEGRDVTLRIGDEEKDRYDRTLAWIFDTDNVLINQQILSEGHARLLPDFGLPPDLEPLLREAESEARIRRSGLWGISGRSKSGSGAR